MTMSSRTDFGWNFTTLTLLWDWRSRAIVTAADALDVLTEDERLRSLTALMDRVSAIARGLEDQVLVTIAFIMVEDLFKSYFHEFRWTPGVYGYIVATAGTVLEELTRRGWVLHYVIDNTLAEADFAEVIQYLPATFSAAGFLVTGPQIMALEAMQRIDGHDRDVALVPQYRTEGHHLADQLIVRCHNERRCSVYLNADLDDGSDGLALDAALTPRHQPATILVFRNEPATPGSVAHFWVPPDVTLPSG